MTLPGDMAEVVTFEIAFLHRDGRVKLSVVKKSEEDAVPARLLLRNLAIKLAGEIAADDVHAGYFWGDGKEFAGEDDVQQFAVLTFLPGKSKKQKGREILQRSSGIKKIGPRRRPASPRFEDGPVGKDEASTSIDKSPRSARSGPEQPNPHESSASDKSPRSPRSPRRR